MQYVTVLRDAGFHRDFLGIDTADDRISNTHKRLFVENVPGPWEPEEGDAVVRLEKGHLEGDLRLVPIQAPVDCAGPFGGENYGVSDDPEFLAACEKLVGGRFRGPILIHDVFETWEEFKRRSS